MTHQTAKNPRIVLLLLHLSITRDILESPVCEGLIDIMPPQSGNSDILGHGMYSSKFFSDWEAQLRISLLPTLPEIPNSPTYETALKQVDESYRALEQAKQLFSRMEKEKGKHSPEELAKAKSQMDTNQSIFNSAEATCTEVAFGVLEKLERLFSTSFDDSDLITYVSLKTATAASLGEWCAKGEEEAALILSTFNDPSLLRIFMQTGGPRDNNYLKAIEIYSQLHPNDPVLQRMALAVSLELAGEIPVKVVNYPIDPIERYLHYEQAYLNGELDPSFSQFSAWEMRHIIDSDAPSDQLAWGRESLRNYRPEHVLTDDPQWRYCRIVRTDVGYNTPDWYKSQRSYDQILSGGGKCGPRAWYGRFICKAFGIPTWGCRQPGHAAMSRWTTQGWQTCLGGGFHVSEWDNRCGNFFLLQTQALYALRSEEANLRQVLRLWMIGNVHSEPSRDLMGRAVPNSKCPWKSLSFLQMKRVAAGNPCKEPLFHKSEVVTMLEKLESAPTVYETVHKVEDGSGTIVLPGTAVSHKARCTYMKCFAGGRQVVLNDNNAEVGYTLTPDLLLSPGWNDYLLTCRVCTVHRNEEPMLLQVTSNKATASHSIPIPYTLGSWQETEPIPIRVHDTGAKLLFVRQSKKYGIAIRCFNLTPVI